jgi:hypothetical protein
MAAEDIGGIYTTKQPGYDDTADIQAALKLFLYGAEGTPPATLAQVSGGIAQHLKSIRQDLTTVDERGIGSDYLTSTEIENLSSPTDGFIAMDSTSTGGSIITTYATALYQNDAPTENLVDGMVWVDKDASPRRAYIYNESAETWDIIDNIQSVIDASGDIIYGTGNDLISRLPIGLEGQLLTVSSGLPSWQDNQQKSWVQKSSGTLSGSSISVSGLNGEKLFVVLHDWSHDDATDSAMLSINFNNNTGPNYINTGGLLTASALHSPAFNDSSTHDITIYVDLANTSSILKPVSTIADNSSGQYFGYFRDTTPISSIQITLSPLGQFDNGTYQVWSYE